MNNKEKYKRVFSTLRTSEHFEFNLEGGKMIRKTFKMRKAITALCFALVLTVGSVSAYAANVGGIQRIIQVWIQGDRTDATLTVNEKEGTYTIQDANGKEIQSGGGVAMDGLGNTRPLTEKELTEHLENEVTTDTIDGRMYLFYKEQKLDITDKFSDKDYCYITLKDGEKSIYVTVTKNGGIATSENRYLMPNEFKTE